MVRATSGRRQEAERDLRAAAGASPAYADVWSALGNTYAGATSRSRPSMRTPA
ncbi:MAG: hypothetical protein ACJ8HJ_08395 [Massilia sp.]